MYNDGYKVTTLTQQKQTTNYIETSTKESDYPTIIYDNKYDEMLCNITDDKTLSYSEPIQQFVSAYLFGPAFKWNINGDLYLSNSSISNGIYKYNSSVNNSAKLFNIDIYPLLQYVVNYQPQYNKVFDIQTFGGRFYGGSTVLGQNNLPEYKVKGEHTNTPLRPLKMHYSTPLKQESNASGDDIITNVEYDFRLTIPRNNPRQENKDWGDRLRGKTMRCEFKSESNILDFSLQYIITKFRMSWS